MEGRDPITDDVAKLLNRSSKRGGGASRRHSEVKMMAIAERRDRAADILADGLVRMLRASDDGGDDRTEPTVSGNGEPGPGEAKHTLRLIPGGASEPVSESLL